jgi:uncharacterized protein
MSDLDLRGVKTVVSHGDCPDGIASALILRAALPGVSIRFVEHNTPEQRLLPATEGMLFCDVAPPRERLQEFVDAGAIVLDHHRAARDVVEAFGARGIFADEDVEPGVCGARLAHREVWCALREDHEDVRRFAERAGIRDCWLTDHPDWETAAAQAAALLFFGFEELARQIADDAPPCLTDAQLGVGRAERRKRMAAARDTADNKLHRPRPELALYNDRDRLLSDVAGLALEADPALAVICGFHFKVTSDSVMLLVCSLRSRPGGIDVSEIAKAHGGGGHYCAAGFGIPVTADTPNPVSFVHEVVSEALCDEAP